MLKYRCYSCILQQWFLQPICPHSRSFSSGRKSFHPGSQGTGSRCQGLCRTCRNPRAPSCPQVQPTMALIKWTGLDILCLVGCDEHTRTPRHSACDGTSADLQGSQCSTKVTFECHLIRKDREKGTNWSWQFVEFVTVTHFIDNINAGIKLENAVSYKTGSKFLRLFPYAHRTWQLGFDHTCSCRWSSGAKHALGCWAPTECVI